MGAFEGSGNYSFLSRVLVFVFNICVCGMPQQSCIGGGCCAPYPSALSLYEESHIISSRNLMMWPSLYEGHLHHGSGKGDVPTNAKCLRTSSEHWKKSIVLYWAAPSESQWDIQTKLCLNSSKNPNFSWKKNSLWLIKGHHRQKQKIEYSKPIVLFLSP